MIYFSLHVYQNWGRCDTVIACTAYGIFPTMEPRIMGCRIVLQIVFGETYKGLGYRNYIT